MPNHKGPIPEIGARFGKLTVIDNTKRINSYPACLCRCDCGNLKTITNTELRNGRKSCGCAKKTLDGKSHTRIYKIYCHMKARCYNPDNDAYDKYGARGIDICQEWRDDFLAFYDWSLANGYSDNLSIDRIDNSKGYSPDNCRWADDETQQNNTRWNHNITYNGKTQSLSKWAREVNLPISTLYGRISNGWDIEAALFMPLQRRNQYTKSERWQAS